VEREAFNVARLQIPRASNADARRFAYCLVIATLLHAAGAISPRHRARHPRPEPKPLRTLVPVSLDDTPAPKPAPRPAPAPPAAPPRAVTPPAPATAQAHVTRAAAVTPAHREPPPEPPSHAGTAPPRASTTPARPAAADRPHRRREPHRPNEETPFGGAVGAFKASVCLIPHSVRSALAVDGCTPVTELRTSSIDVAPRRFTDGFPGIEKRVDWFGIDYRGAFKVRETSYYTFRLLSDDGAVLFIDGEKVIDNDGQHGPRSEKMSLPLSKGEHEFRLLYYQGPGGSLALQLFVKGYKTDERLFGPEL
jgi:hypothetical protein